MRREIVQVRCLTCMETLWTGVVPITSPTTQYAVRELTKDHAQRGHNVRLQPVNAFQPKLGASIGDESGRGNGAVSDGGGT